MTQTIDTHVSLSLPTSCRSQMGDFDFKSSAPPSLRRTTVVFRPPAPPVPPLDLSALQSYRQLFRLSTGLSTTLPPDLLNFVCEYSLMTPNELLNGGHRVTVRFSSLDIHAALARHYPPMLGWVGSSETPSPVRLVGVQLRADELCVSFYQVGLTSVHEHMTLRAFWALNPFVPPAMLWDAPRSYFSSLAELKQSASLDLQFALAVEWLRSDAFDPEHKCYVGGNSYAGCRCNRPERCKEGGQRRRACKCKDCIRSPVGGGPGLIMECADCTADLDGFDFPWEEGLHPLDRPATPGHVTQGGVWLFLLCAKCDAVRRRQPTT